MGRDLGRALGVLWAWHRQIWAEWETIQVLNIDDSGFEARAAVVLSKLCRTCKVCSAVRCLLSAPRQIRLQNVGDGAGIHRAPAKLGR